MTHKLSITVDDDIFVYLEAKSGKNRSGFINDLLRDRQQQDFEQELKQQLLEDAVDPEVQGESTLWEQAPLSDEWNDWKDDWDDSKVLRNLVG